MTKLSKLVIGAVSLACFVDLVIFAVLYLFSSNRIDNRNPAKQEEMLATVLEWGRLAPFPAHATDVSVETEGNSFTRSFRASFVATKQEIEAWVKSSPGLNEVTPEKVSENKVKYLVTPGGGANKAEITIDFALNKVLIYVSWG